MSRYIIKGVPFRTKGAVNVEDCKIGRAHV